MLRRSFASVANDLGYTEVTVAALGGYSEGFLCAILSRKLFILLHRKSYENIDMSNFKLRNRADFNTDDTQIFGKHSSFLILCFLVTGRFEPKLGSD